MGFLMWNYLNAPAEPQFVSNPRKKLSRIVQVVKKTFYLHIESRRGRLEITPEKLAFHNIDMKFVAEPGDFEIMIGSSSRDEDLSRINCLFCY